jgi:DNA-directed RNA polymerase beta' subunit
MCWQCGAPNKWKIAVSETDAVTITRMSPAEAKPQKMPAALVLRILAAISDSDAHAMGLTPETHPARMVLQKVPVLPVTMRMPHNKDGGREVQDDITTLLQMVQQTNSAVAADQALAPDAAQEDLQAKLGMLLRATVRNDEEKAQSRLAKAQDKQKTRVQASQQGAEMTPMGARLGGKRGHIRSVQMGRRSGHQARAVIANNPTLPLDTIMIPLLIARKLQVEEFVQPYNHAHMAALLQNNTAVYPGCTQVVRRDGTVYRADAIPPDFVLEIGDRVMRDLVNGDYVMFNRMPSLEWSAGTTFKVLVAEATCTRYVVLMNVHVCVLFNADFDGDQMNIWHAQNCVARAEISLLSSASQMLISPRDVRPRMGATYDTIVGGARLCMEEKISRWMAMLIAQSAPEPPRFPGGGTVTGRDIVSGVLPPINLSVKTSMSNDKVCAHVPLPASVKMLVIEEGRVVQGVLDKKGAGEGASNGVYHTIANRYGADAALRAIFAVMQLSIGYLSRVGHTMSLGDLWVTPRGQKRLTQIASAVRAEIDLLVSQLAAGRVVAPVGQTVSEFFEQQLMATMDVHGDALAAVLETVDPAQNGFFQLIATGAKGKPANYTSIAGIGGAVTVNARLNEMNGGFKRLYPWTRRFDYAEWGMVYNSILNGVTFHEMFEGARAGRFALIGKALLTSVAGEQYRNTAKNTEAVITDHFGRLLEGPRVLANFYGNTGYDPRLLVEVKLAEYWASDADFEKLLAAPLAATKELTAALQRAGDALRKARAAVRAAALAEEAGAANMPASEKCVLPVNVKHLLMGLVRQHKGPAATAAQLARMLDAVDRYAGGLAGHYAAPGARDRLPAHFASAARLLEFHLRAALAPANLARATPEILEHVLQQTTAATLKALVSAGSCVGTIAAQVFGEPFTQYMLDSMHNVAQGGTSRDVASAVKVLLSASVNFNRAMYVVPASGVPAKVLANHIELTRVWRFVSKWQLFAEKMGAAVHPDYVHENRLVAQFLQMNQAAPPPAGLLHACLRFEIDRVVMMMRNVQVEEVVAAIMQKFRKTYVVWTSETAGGAAKKRAAAGALVLRVYVEASHFNKQAPTKQAFLALKDEILDLPVRGVIGVREAKIFSVVRTAADETGAMRSRGVEMVEAVGSNLLDLMFEPGVDALRTISTATWDVYNMFGAVAARRAVESGIIAAGGEAAADYYHGHRQVYATLIMSRGEPTSMLQGISERHPNMVLLAASHKQALQVFARAAANGTVDMCRDPAAATMMGQTPRIGTNYSTVLVDEEAMKKRFGNPMDVLDALM